MSLRTDRFDLRNTRSWFPGCWLLGMTFLLVGGGFSLAELQGQGEPLVRASFEAGVAKKASTRAWEATGGVVWGDGFTGRAPQFSVPGASLVFPLGQDGLDPWLSPTEGSIRFRFRPEWRSGKGPGHYASFFSIGEWAPEPTVGYWALTTNPDGTQIIFSGQSAEGGTTFLAAPVLFEPDRWYDLMLVYSGAASRLSLDGAVIGNGKGVVTPPPLSALKQYGLRIGNNHRGHQPIRGRLDEFEYFGGPRSSFLQRRDAYALSATVTEDPWRVQLVWRSRSKRRDSVRRRKLGDSEWTLKNGSLKGNRYTDSDPGFAAGQRYEYAVGSRRVVVGLGRQPATERRGRVLLVVTKDLGRRIAGELGRFSLDLVGDGWEIEQAWVSEHRSSIRSRYRRLVGEVKDRIRAFYQKAPSDDNVVLLIGNVPIPYSGAYAEDGHEGVRDDHRGGWPCDAFYGDMDGRWTDTSVDHTNRTHGSNTNRPGDGRFDQDFLPSALELAVSRIDFSNLPSITGASLPGKPTRASRIEAGLMQRYFEKNHAYRHGEWNVALRSVAQNYLPQKLWANMDQNAFRNGAALFGTAPNSVMEADCFQVQQPVSWAFFAGYGGSQSVGSGRYQTAFLNRPDFGAHAVFIMLYASWSADWNLRDSFTKSLLVSPMSGLVAMSSLHGQWQLGPMALGEPLSFCYLQTANRERAGKGVRRSMGVLGDATLRLHVAPPVSSVRGRVDGAGVELTWQYGEALTGDLGVYVYRAASVLGPYSRVSGAVPVAGTTFRDTRPPAGEPFYLIRRAVETSSPAGRYVNLSQGRFWKLP